MKEAMTRPKFSHSCRRKPPYKWTTFVMADRKRITLSKGQGSWLTAFFNAQDWEKYWEEVTYWQYLKIASKNACHSRMILGNKNLKA